MTLPNYEDGSIVNLMSSIARARGGRTMYNTLRILPPAEIADSKNIVLMVLDGLGYEWIKRHGKDSVFAENMKGSMTSVFPSSTTSAVMTFVTGVPPQQSGALDWYLYLKELGMQVLSLPFIPRVPTKGFELEKVNASHFFIQKPFYALLKTNVYRITHRDYVDNHTSKATSGRAKRVGYKNLNDYFRKIKNVIGMNNQKKYISAYWPEFDSFFHKYGSNGRKLSAHFKQLDKKVKSLARSLKGTDTTLIITADHGLIDAPNKVLLDDHPKLEECLALPLSGWRSVAYAHVRSDMVKQFETYVRTHLKKQCTLHKSKDLVRKNYFGLGKPNSKLLERAGDYTIIMKPGYAIYQFVPGEKEHYWKGIHGGLSNEEMLVPLVVINT